MTKQMNWRDYERNTEGVKKADVLKIELAHIHVRKGFNPRDLGKPETQAKIEGIKNSYKNGVHVPPILVALVGSKAEVVDGHCRYEAAVRADKELKSEGGLGLPALVCIPFKGNDLDRLVQTVLGNEGEKLTPIECAEVVKRLLNQGHTREKVAQLLNYTIGWVDRLKFAGNLPEAVKQQVKEGKISLDVAAKRYREHGEDAAEAIEKEVAEVKEKGDKRVTQKHTDKGQKKKLAETQFHLARDLAFALPEKIVKQKTLTDDKEYDLKLNGKTIKLLQQLQDSFTLPETQKSDVVSGMSDDDVVGEDIENDKKAA
jgi:ParB family transcriptional regulator, chromosome partitioning protein